MTAETIAVATALGYALAFLYQSGFVGYYGVPLEIIRVSPEWVIFTALLLVPSVLGFFTGFTVADWIAAQSGTAKWAARITLVVAGFVCIASSWLVGAGRWAALLLLTGIVLLSLAASDFFEERRERNKRNWVVVTAAITLIVGFTMSGMHLIGNRAAAVQSDYMVDPAHERVLVYSTDSLLVLADYDPVARSLESTLTLMSTGSIDVQGLSLVRTKTGSLASASLK